MAATTVFTNQSSDTISSTLNVTGPCVVKFTASSNFEGAEVHAETAVADTDAHFTIPDDGCVRTGPYDIVLNYPAGIAYKLRLRIKKAIASTSISASVISG